MSRLISFNMSLSSQETFDQKKHTYSRILDIFTGLYTSMKTDVAIPVIL